MNKYETKFLNFFNSNFSEDYELKSSYKGRKKEIIVKHKKCGLDYKTRPDSLYAGHGCPECWKKDAGSYHKKDIMKFKEEVKDIFGNEYEVLSEEYINNATPILVQHNSPLCNYHKYKVSPGNLIIRKRKCPICSKKHVGSNIQKGKGWNNERFLLEVSKFSDINEYEFMEEYKKYDDKIKIKHLSCGKTYFVSPSMFIRGRRCPFCKRSSNGEKRIESYLIRNNIPYEREYSFDDLKSDFSNLNLRFDFAIFNKENEINFLIEFDGSQHFLENKKFTYDIRKLQKNDEKKNNYCLMNNLKLIRINYKEIKNLEKILDSKLKI